MASGFIYTGGGFAVEGDGKIVLSGIAGAGQSPPAPADYFGTGRDDITVYLAHVGAFAVRHPAGGPDVIGPFGLPGVGRSIPIPGDYDGSGHVEIAVYDPNYASFAYRPANGGADVLQDFGTVGLGSSLPAAPAAGAISGEVQAVANPGSATVSAASVVVSKSSSVPAGPAAKAVSARVARSVVAQAAGNPLAGRK